MLPILLAAVGGYLVYDSLKSEKFADGGMMANGGKVDYGSLYQKIIKAVQKDLKISKEDATNLVDEKEAFIVDMIEYEGIKSPNRIAEAITSDYGEYAKGGMAKGGLTKSETLKVAEKFAKALSKTENKKVTVNMRTLEEGSFDLDMDGIEYDGGSYNIYDNGDVKNMAISGSSIYGKTTSTVDEIVKNLSKKMTDGGIMAKGGKTKKKGDVGKSGTQYGYTLKEYEEMGEKMGLFVSPKNWWKSQEGKKYEDSFGRTQTIGRYSGDEEQEMMRYGYRIAIGMDLGSDKIPASARKYVIDNNLEK